VNTDLVPKRTIAETLEDLEAMWACYDQIWDSFSPTDWQRPYGKDWTFADQPFHMAYFDRVVVNDPIEAGADLPAAERWNTRTMRDLNEWNAREFATRPSDETPERSRERWQLERDRMRTILSKHTDADLDTRPFHFHLMSGDSFTMRDGVTGSVVHNWGELSELRHRANRLDIPLVPRATETAVSFYVLFMSMFGRADAVTKPFTLAIEITGPGAGTWAIRVGDGGSEATAGRPADADVTFRMSADDFNMVMIRQATNPMKAMLTGRIKVRGVTKMPKMRRVFPPPGLDEPFATLG
jgi:SCP-2 sterol transfer family/DinB superfamily